MGLRWADVPSHLLPLAWGISEALHRIIDRVKRILELATTTTKEERGRRRGSQIEHASARGGGGAGESSDEGMGRRGDVVHSRKKREGGGLASRVELGPSVQAIDAG
jgi:hypothetical protein